MNGVQRSDLQQKIPLTLTPNDHLFKNGDLCGIWGNSMEINSDQRGIHGAYWKGMRHFSIYTLDVAGKPLLPITPLSDGGNGPSPFLFSLILLGPSITSDFASTKGESFFVDGPLLVRYKRFCLSNGFEDNVEIENHAPFDIQIPIAIKADADFRDIMDIRGIRSRWPRHTIERFQEDTTNELLLTCLGEDGVRRSSLIRLWGSNFITSAQGFEGKISIVAKGTTSFQISSLFDEGKKNDRLVLKRNTPEKITQLERLDKKKERIFRSKWPKISSDQAPLDRWCNNALRDLRILLTPQTTGSYPYAGIPWFSTPFGRDALITGFFTLWTYPELSRSILAFLAKNQAKRHDDLRDAQPGKILHEYRYGEVANDPSIPFSCYYGSVDSTPLFIALAAEYLKKTGNRSFLLTIRPALHRAMGWIENFGINPDSGFLVYSGDQEGGLIQKGWKDSGDSIFHADGRIAPHPIALSEVQGYLYMAYNGYAALLAEWGDNKKAQIYIRKATNLKKRFNDLFWSPTIRMFALAIDGERQPCEVRSSNAGHLLFTGIAKTRLARKTGRELLQPDMFSGYGIRTIGSNEIRYNPVSYHNGSIWPHDNALIIQGLKRYGLIAEAKQLADAYLSALSLFPGERPPELYCGFSKDNTTSGPLPYPTSCRIQAWSVTSFFMVLQVLQSMRVKT
ncbi:MAG: glycogen debranching N-terminal domain-containing protein [Leptospirillia bacterium]